MNQQISMDELLKQEQEPIEPIYVRTGEKCYLIPDDVWENRCRLCIHKNAEKNALIPHRYVYKPYYTKLVPCRILTVARPNDMPGECMSFSPRLDTYGICETCVYNNQFSERFCRKANHGKQHRVYWGKEFGGDEKTRDYWGRHRFSACDDYEPDENVKNGVF